jgi:hypothetical protein
MPTAQFNQHESLEKSIMHTDQGRQAHRVWEELSVERDRFVEGVGEDLLLALYK